MPTRTALERLGNGNGDGRLGLLFDVQQRTAVRIAVGDQVGVAVQLGGVAKDVRAEVAKPEGHTAGEKRREPAEHAEDEERDREGRRYEQGRDCEQEAKARYPAALTRPRLDRDVDRVRATVTGEAGKRVRDQEQEGEDVHVVADECAREPVQRLR